METLLTYILQVNLLLALIFLGYHFLLKSLTFNTLNRIYFLSGSIYAFAYPFVDIKSWFQKNEMMPSTFIPELLPSLEMPEASVNEITLLEVIIMVVGVLAMVFVFKLLVQLFSLLRIHMHSQSSTWQSFVFRNVVFPVVPFSFFNKIYLHKQQHQENELQDIFAHEIIHVRGHHTVDILLFEMILVVCWCNPFVWLMRKAVRENLEYLTDQQVLNKGMDKQTYQYSLLNVTQKGVAVGMSNHFNFKTLKKRIMMMNKKRSSKLELSKYVFLLPVFLISGASFTVSKAEKDIDKIVEKSQQTTVISEPLQVKMQGKVAELLNQATGTDVIQIDTPNQEKEYPLLAPDFNRKELEGKNLHFQIDGKLVSLDEFLEFPRTEIAGVDIYKDEKEIFQKIGKRNSEGLFVMTSKNYLSNKQSISENKRILSIIKTGESDSLRTKDGRLIIIDSKYGSEEAIKKLSADDIKSILVMKDTTLAKHGEVYIITNKSSTVAQKGALTLDQIINGEELAQKRRIAIRGTLRGNSGIKPLLVVDNVVIDSNFEVNDLNPYDIESISLLNGENANAVYGDKGKNGVIVITTNKNNNKPIVVNGFQVDSVKSDSIKLQTKGSIKEITVTGYKK